MGLVTELKKGNHTLTLKVQELQKEKDSLIAENEELKKSVRTIENEVKRLKHTLFRPTTLHDIIQGHYMCLNNILRGETDE